MVYYKSSVKQTYEDIDKLLEFVDISCDNLRLKNIEPKILLIGYLAYCLLKNYLYKKMPDCVKPVKDTGNSILFYKGLKVFCIDDGTSSTIKEDDWYVEVFGN